MKRKKGQKPFDEMSVDELERATAEFDREFSADTFRPMTAREKVEWERARRKVGRPRRGKGAKVISVSIERDLLRRTDALARKMGVPRASLIEKGLRAALIIQDDSKE